MNKQRVLLVGASQFDTPIDSFHRALELFYDVRIFNPYSTFGGFEDYFGPSIAGRMNTSISRVMKFVTGEYFAYAEGRLLRYVSRFKPNIILTTCAHQLRAATVEKLRKNNKNCKIVSVYSDAICNFGRGYFFGADYDALFFKDHYIVEKFCNMLGWKHVHYLPQACDRKLHRPLELSEDDHLRFGCDITVAGNPYLYRAERLRPLLKHNLKVWGKPPARWTKHPSLKHFTGYFVAGDEKCKAMLAASIVLNQVHYAEINGTNKRNFEVAGIGAFQITDAIASVEFFDPITEVPIFKTYEEQITMIDNYLADPILRNKMAKRAHIRAHAEHTYEHRWIAILKILGMITPEAFLP